MAIAILKTQIEVGNHLNTLSTSRELLMDVIDAVVTARSECTDNDPSGARGWRGWQMGTRRNREVHCSFDSEWKRDETDQIASIVHKKLGLRFVVCNTDENTCVEARNPRNRSKKGAGTDRVVDASQMSFDFPVKDCGGVVVPIRPEPDEKGAFRTYYLCVYHEGDDIRAELSCAVEMANGFFGEFKERIFIVGGEAGEIDPIKQKKNDDGDDSSDFDIPVIRKN